MKYEDRSPQRFSQLSHRALPRSVDARGGERILKFLRGQIAGDRTRCACGRAAGPSLTPRAARIRRLCDMAPLHVAWHRAPTALRKWQFSRTARRN